MNLTQMIAELEQERAALDDAITVLERIARSGKRRRGRPPSFLSTYNNGGAPKRSLSPATKKKMAIAQRKRWAEYRKQKESS